MYSKKSKKQHVGSKMDRSPVGGMGRAGAGKGLSHLESVRRRNQRASKHCSLSERLGKDAKFSKGMPYA